MEKSLRKVVKKRNTEWRTCERISYYSDISNQCAYPVLALPDISDSSPGDKSKQMLAGEMSDGSCP